MKSVIDKGVDELVTSKFGGNIILFHCIIILKHNSDDKIMNYNCKHL